MFGIFLKKIIIIKISSHIHKPGNLVLELVDVILSRFGLALAVDGA